MPFTGANKGILGARPLRWFLWENEDGKVQPFVERVILVANPGIHAAIAVDFNRHGDVDLVCKLWRPRKDNASGGSKHVDSLANLTRSPR
jgi:hypothetical protein